MHSEGPVRRRLWMPAAVFALAGLSATAGAAPVGDGAIVIEASEAGAGAPGSTYTVNVTGSNFSTAVQVASDHSVTVSSVPPGTYVIAEAEAPPGVTIAPNPVTVGVAETVTVTIVNPYPAGRFSLFRPPNEGVANCAVTIRDTSGVPLVVVPLDQGATVTTDWLPLGSYVLTWPTVKSFTMQPAAVEVDGATVAVTSCVTVFPRPHPSGRIAIDVVELGPSSGVPYTFVIAWAGAPVYDAPVNEPIQATVLAGQTWTSPSVPSGTYRISTSGTSVPTLISPNPVTLPATCFDAEMRPHWCTGSEPPTSVSVTIGAAPGSGSSTPPAAAEPSSPTLPPTGIERVVLLTMATVIAAVGLVAYFAARWLPLDRPRTSGESGSRAELVGLHRLARSSLAVDDAREFTLSGVGGLRNGRCRRRERH